MNDSVSWRSSVDYHFLRKLVKLAVPVALQCVIFSLLGLIDLIMVGQLGEAEAAAVGLGNRVFFFNLIITVAAGSALTILASQFTGANNPAGIRRSVVHAVSMAVGLTVPFVLFYTITPATVVRMMANDSELVTLASLYLLITAPSIFCTAIVVPLEAVMRAKGDSSTPLQIGAFSVALNIALNWLLIYGNLGFPELGVAGSAWGTALSRLAQTLCLLWAAKHRKREVIPQKRDIIQSNTFSEWSRFLKVFCPIVLQDGSWALGLLIYHAIFSSIGVDELAIMSTVSSIESILISLFVGFSIGGSVLVGHSLGANRFRTAWYRGWTILSLSPLVAFLIGTTMYLLRTELAAWLGIFSEENIHTVSQVIAIAGFGLCLRVVNLAGIHSMLRSGGDVNATVWFNITAMWVIGLPATWYAAEIGLPLPLVFLCSLSEELFKAVMVTGRVASGRWLRNIVS